MEIGNGVDREHRSDSRENWGRFSARAATRGANVRTTCVGGSVLLSFTLAKSQSRLTPTRAASERPSNPLRPLPSQPSLPSSLPPSSKRVCAPAALLASPSFFRFYPLLILLRILFFFFFQPPANLTADNRAITKDCKGEKRGGGGVERIPRNARTRVPRGYPSLFFFLFFSPESNPLCREGCEERKEGVEMKEFFFSSGMRLFLWWRGCFFLRYFLLEKLCCFGIDNRWFWDGVFLSLSTCE